jgi:hypothetical protein
MRCQDIIRLILAVAFFAGAGVNAYLALDVPEVYERFADFSFLRIYRSLWSGMVLSPSAAVDSPGHPF